MTYSGIGEMPLGTHECAGNNRRARARVVAVVKPRKLQATKRLWAHSETKTQSRAALFWSPSADPQGHPLVLL